MDRCAIRRLRPRVRAWSSKQSQTSASGLAYTNTRCVLPPGFGSRIESAMRRVPWPSVPAAFLTTGMSPSRTYRLRLRPARPLKPVLHRWRLHDMPATCLFLPVQAERLGRLLQRDLRRHARLPRPPQGAAPDAVARVRALPAQGGQDQARLPVDAGRG